jgi:HEAT repeat protein
MVRLSAAIALTRKGSNACDEVLLLAIKDQDYGIRSMTARVLGGLDFPGREKLLAVAIVDKNIRVRTSATRALGMMGGSKAFPLLLEKLKDSQEVVRTYAAGNIIKLMK